MTGDTYQDLVAWSTVVQAAAAFIGLGLAILLFDLNRRLLKTTEHAATAAKTSADAVMLAERAYVTMSHCEPGVIREDDFVLTGADQVRWRQFGVKVKIQNFGNTPAMVTDVVLAHQFGDGLPKVPPLPRSGAGKHAFLVRGDSFESEQEFKVLADDMEAAEAGRTKLFILGFVDYVDQFGERHRAGYAREFDHTARQGGIAMGVRREGSRHGVAIIPDANNLMFVAEPGYNYDRKRSFGEGRDWLDERVMPDRP